MFRGLFGRTAGRGSPPPEPPLAAPIRLCGSGTLAFDVGTSARRDIEHRVGPAITYPSPGWQTWITSGPRSDTWILSAFYKGNLLVGVEHYVAKRGECPTYAPRIRDRFRFVPDDLGLGSSLTSLPGHFVSAAGLAGGVRAVVYQELFVARWPSGLGVIAGNDGKIERLALYANLG